MLKSVWERSANDVFLIGPQHFDLSIAEVRDKLTEISVMRNVIAKDLWDSQQSAHAQVIDLQTGKEAATQLGSLLLTASLSTAVNAVKGLTADENGTLATEHHLVDRFGGRLLDVTVPFIVRADRLRGQREYYFWFFGYVAKLPWEGQAETRSGTGEKWGQKR